MQYPLRLPTNFPLLTLTHPSSSIWLIELHHGEDNRLTPTLIDDALKPALDAVERDWSAGREAAQARKEKDLDGARGALIIVGKRNQDKFFSNGLDMRSIGDKTFFPLTFNPLLARLLTFPIPTIAAINGHCFAGGMMLSLACDYRVMTDGKKKRAWMCMNEIHFGAPWPLSFTSILRAKIGSHVLQRKIALEGYRFTPQECLELGLVDYVVEGGTDGVLAKATELAETSSANARSGVWGWIKGDIYRDVIEVCGMDHALSDGATAKARL